MALEKDSPAKNNQDPLLGSDKPNETDTKDEKAIKEIELIESDDALNDEKTETTKITSINHKKWFLYKKLYIPAIAIFLLALIFIIPYTRYKILGLFLSEKYSITVIDSQSLQPVISANVSIDGKVYKTNTSGKAIIKAKVGNQNISISKQYYASYSHKIIVPISQKNTLRINLTATGRQVAILVTNKIDKQPVSGMIVSSSGSSQKTNISGIAFLVLPADKKIANGTISGTGYNNSKITIDVNSTGNHYLVVPSGSIYYLSNTSGLVDVVKANLDGSNQTTVLAGNISEGIYDTSLNPSSDWSYLALVANRNNSKPCLSIIQTSNDSSYIVDSTNGNYNIIGWDSNNTLVYTVQNNNLPAGSMGEYELKSYNSATNQTKVLYQSGSQTNSTSTINEVFNSVNLMPNNSVVYSTAWVGNVAQFNDLLMNITSINDNGTGQKTLQQFSQSSYSPIITSHFYQANNLIFWLYPLSSSATNYYQYVNSQFSPLSGSSSIVSSIYTNPINYPESPSGSKVVYANNINGHSAVYTSDLNGNNPKQLGLYNNTYVPYSWYTGNYIIVNKSNNEFYIMSSTQPTIQQDLLKICNHL